MEDDFAEGVPEAACLEASPDAEKPDLSDYLLSQTIYLLSQTIYLLSFLFFILNLVSDYLLSVCPFQALLLSKRLSK